MQSNISRLAGPFSHLCRAILTLLLCGTVLWAPVAATQTSVTPARLEEKIEDVAASTELNESEKEELLTLLQTALKDLGRAKEFAATTAEFQTAIENSPREIEGFNAMLAAPQEQGVSIDELLPDGAALDEIESKLALELTNRNALIARRSTLQQHIDSAPARAEAARSRMIELRSRLDKLVDVQDSSDSNLERQIIVLINRVKRSRWLAELASLEAETLSQAARIQLAAVERSWTVRAITESGERLNALNEAADVVRTAVAAQELQTVDELAAELSDAVPRLQGYAAGNRSLAENLALIAEQIDLVTLQSERIEQQQEQIEDDSRVARRRLDVGGRIEVLGRLMMAQLEQLPDIAQLKRSIRERNELISNTALAQIDHDEEARALGYRSRYLDSRMPDRSAWDSNAHALGKQLLDQREQLLARTMRRYDNLLRRLVDTNSAAQQLIESTVIFDQFLMGNLLWVRNFGFVDAGVLRSQLATLFSWQQWRSIPARVSQGLQASSLGLVGVLGLLLLLVFRRRTRTVYERLMTTPTTVSAEKIAFSLNGLLLTVILAAPWPLALMLIGEFLAMAPDQTPFVLAIERAFLISSRTLLVLLFLRILVGKQGVARRHLKWNSKVLEALRQELNWLGPLIVFGFFLAIFAINDDSATHGGALGAIATLLTTLAFLVVSVRLLRQEVIVRNRYAKFGLRLMIALSTAVVLMQLLGFLFAAEVYLLAIWRSVMVVLAVIALSDILERWLLILRARLERKTREEIRVRSEDGDDHVEEVEDLIDVVSLSQAHTQLLALGRLAALSVCLWLIWSPSLPAFNLLDAITLWQVADPGGAEGALRAVTLVDLAKAIFIIAITALATRHLPSLVQVILLERMNVSAGGRYASAMLLQYTVIAVGASMFLAMLGWQWSHVQWLVAALGVGIGFGLQEIVANFISGLIILFERPIRVGDIVTVGDADGTVRKINIRATIIETFDRKELLVPNKDFITGQLVNWSLSDGAVRLLIEVGVAYGSDVRKAMQLLMEAANEHAMVLEDPEPRVTFDSFGDNALVLMLRCYVSEERSRVWTDLRVAINDKFLAADICIAYPQRDVHLDFSGPLRIERDGAR